MQGPNHMLKQLCAGLALAALLTTGTAASDYVVSSGKLSDDNFYRLVACGAKPGGRCPDKYTKWSRQAARKLTVSVSVTDANFPAATLKQISAAVGQAVSQLNDAGAAVSLTLIKGTRANIRIYLVDAPINGTIRGTGNASLDGRRIEAAFTSINWWTESGIITNAQIAISHGILPQDIRSIVLEEITQALGLIHDIRNPYYDARSIFSEDGNTVTRITGQDRMALQRLYAGK
jgi:hypothetical protein